MQRFSLKISYESGFGVRKKITFYQLILYFSQRNNSVNQAPLYTQEKKTIFKTLLLSKLFGANEFSLAGLQSLDDLKKNNL